MQVQGDQKPRILIIDDDPSVIEFIHDALISKYTIETAMTGIDGLMQARFVKPDLILLDIEIGDIDGYTVCQKLKSFNDTKSIPVIFISSAFGTLDKLKAFQSGGVDYITKPIEVAELDARVHTHLTIHSLQMDLEQKVDSRTKELLAKQAWLKETNERQRSLLKTLKESEHRYRTFIEAANDGICILKDGRFVDCNSKLEKMLKASRRQILGKSPAHFAPRTQPDGSDSNQMAEQKLQAAKEGRPQIFDWQHRDTAGQLLRTEICLNATPFKGVTYILAIVRDVTRRKQMEQTLNTQTDELLKTNQALQAMLDYRETEKRIFEKTILTKLEERIFPYLRKLEKAKLSQNHASYLKIIQSNLNELIPSAQNTLTSAYVKLAPTEVKIADLIRLGNQTKEIADSLNLTPKTVSWYRGNIRKKLGLAQKKINLRTYLSSLS
jgi:PAS domain S-box-containing protein